MIFSRYEEFSDAQAETTVAAHASTNQVDLQAAGDAIGREMWVHIAVNTALTSGGSATVAIALQCDNDSAFGSPKTLWSLAATAFDDAAFTPGKELCGIRLPAGCERYVRVVYTIGTAVLTGGKFDAFLTNNLQRNDPRS